jgi:D-alanyl-D-alanine carboxypeptidase (penicillin-binding protein 5/6)
MVNSPVSPKIRPALTRMVEHRMHALSRNRSVIAAAALACFVAGLALAIAVGSSLSPREAYSQHLYPPSAVYVEGYQKGITVGSRAAVLLDASTGTVLFGKNEHQRRDPASTTKVMTAILAIELGLPDSVVTVSSRAAWTQGSSLNLQPGDNIHLSELVKGMMLESGNDGSVAIAEHIAGTVTRFAEMMTLRARQIGAINSSFRNPHGLTAVNHYSTAYDLAMITRHAMTYPEFRAIVATASDIMRYTDGRVQPITNTNKLLFSYPGADGVKTGTTTAAGQCLIASATRDGWQLIAVVLASGSRWYDAQRLLEYGFESFVRKPLAAKGSTIAAVPVLGGRSESVTAVPASDLTVTVRREHEGLIELSVDLPDSVTAPVRSGAKLGKLVAMVDGSEVGSVDLIAQDTVKRRGLGGLLFDRF